jgi:hypothetical protein
MIPSTLNNFWNNRDEDYKINMLIIFLELNYGIETNEPYNYIRYFTDENINRFLQCF